MNFRNCCRVQSRGSSPQPAAAPTPDTGPQRQSIARRGMNVAGLAIPGFLLAVLPKCPVCLAAYILVWTGVWLPLTTATYLRTSLILLSVASLLFLTARFLFRLPVAKEALSRAIGRLSTIRPKETTQ